jgi:hypothetical protein
VTTGKWIAFATSLVAWGGTACSGPSDSAGNFEGSTADAGEDTTVGSASDGASTHGDTTTSAGGIGSAGGTDGTTGPGGAPDGGAGGMGGDGGTGAMACPSVEPQLDASCSEGQTCTFVYCESPRYLADRTLTCVDNAWVLSDEVPCDDAPPPACPSYIPSLGQSCDASETTGPCSSLDACGNLKTLWCNDSEWSTSRPAGAPTATGGGSDASAVASSTTGIFVEPMCPLEPPVLGESCCPNDIPEYCDYRAEGAGGSGGGGSGGSGGDSSAGGSGGANLVPVTSSTTTDVTGSVGGSGGSGGAPAAECVACSSSQVWTASELCP